MTNLRETLLLWMILVVIQSAMIRCEDSDSPMSWSPSTDSSMGGDSCQGFVCENYGTCHSFGSSSPDVFCSCDWPFTGQFCEITNDICASNPCRNGGSCFTPTTDTLYCSCLSGWRGKYCEINDAGTGCSINICQHGGTCFDIGTNSGTYCVCNWMYTGGFCETVINSDSCASDPCENGGTCIPDEDLGYLCACPTGLSGNLCQENSDDDGCSSSVCQNGGTCYFIGAVDNTYCLCPLLYTGDACETAIEMYNCDTNNPCDNEGSCYPTGATYVCVCTQGWTGDNCQVNYDTVMCALSPPCGPDGNGACVVVGGSTQCMCYNGWTGGDCQTSVESDGTTGESTSIPIIAGAAGGFVVLLLVVGCFVYCVVSNRNKQRREATAPTAGPRPYPMVNTHQREPKFIDPNPPPYNGYVVPPDAHYYSSANPPEYHVALAPVSKAQGALQIPSNRTPKPAKMPPNSAATPRSPREEYTNNVYEEIPEPAAAMEDGESYMVPSAQRDVNQNTSGQSEYVEVIS